VRSERLRARLDRAVLPGHGLGGDPNARAVIGGLEPLGVEDSNPAAALAVVAGELGDLGRRRPSPLVELPEHVRLSLGGHRLGSTSIS
jgi:hypothetical protein